MLKYMNEDVAYLEERVRMLSNDDLYMLRETALKKTSGKLRICTHPSPGHLLHEMFIALRKDVYYPPHRSVKTEETHFVLHGLATLYIYTDDGKLERAIPMGPFDSGRCSYVRLPAGAFHCLIVESDVCIYYETKLGPFDPDDTEIAPFNGPDARLGGE